MSKYTKEMSKNEILIELANIRTDLLNAVNTIEAIAKNIVYKSAEIAQSEECDHCVYKWGMKGGDDE